jgi:DNA polymerase
MAKSHGLKVSDDKADEFKNAWRSAHPRTKQTWRDYQSAAILAVRHPGDVYPAGHPTRAVKFKMVGSFLWALLPSGRVLCFPYPKILEGSYGPQLTHMAVPGPDKKKIIHDNSNASNWARVACHGGTLMGNITPAICRDLLVCCMLQLDDAGAAIDLHVHDEIVIEVDDAKAEGARIGMQKIMRSVPEWAKDFPLWADCDIMQRYGK